MGGRIYIYIYIYMEWQKGEAGIGERIGRWVRRGEGGREREL